MQNARTEGGYRNMTRSSAGCDAILSVVRGGGSSEVGY